MGKNRSASGITNVIQYDNNGNITFVSGSTTLMQVSSSGAITTTGVISGSNALSASFSLNSALLNGTGSVGFATTASLLTVSSSQQQISASQQQLSSSFLTLTASFNAVSSSQQQISSSYIALSASYNTFSGSASTRITANSSSIQQVSASQQQISSSQQQISSSLLNVISIFATTGSNSFRATQSITGSLTVTGQIIAQTLNVQQVTSSIIYSSGSNNFGCDLNSRQTFTGSVLITGSLTIAGASSATSYSGTTIYGSTIACSPIGCFATSCATAFIGGTMSGTTIYGSTVICGASICTTGNTCFGGMSIINSCLGIGTSAPLSLLHIASADTDQGIRLTRANGTYGVRITRTGQIQAKLVDDVTFQTAISLTEGNASGSQYLGLQPTAGNVSIGATGGVNPGAKLEVQDGANVAFSGTGYRLAIFSSTCAANADRPGITLGYDSAGGGIIAPATQAGTTNFLSFWTYNSGWGEKLRIAKDGQSTFSNTITANGGNILSCGASYGIVQVKGSGASTWQMFANPSDEMRFGRSGVGDYLTITNTGAASFACSVNFNGNSSIVSKVGGIYNGTTTVTIGPSSWNGVMQIMVGVYGNGSGNTGRAMWIGGGYVGSGMPFTEVTRYCAGAVTIGALNANAGCYTFTVGYAFPNNADISVTVIGTNANTAPATIAFG